MTEPIVGDIVHLLHGGRCYAAIVTEVGDNGTALTSFHPPNAPQPPAGYEAYNSLSSARPTAGWHWIEEHQ